MRLLICSFLLWFFLAFSAYADTSDPPDVSINSGGTFGDFVCSATQGITSILPSSPSTFQSLSESIESNLPFLGTTLIANMLFDIYVVLKLVITYKTLKIIGGRL